MEEHRMDDLISRQAAIELILSGKVGDDSTEWVGVECPEECNSFLEWAAEEVGKMPPAERKKGRWIKDGEAYALYKCSACNNLCTVAGWANCVPEEQMYKGFKFCPNCGAEMENSDEQIR